VRLSPKPLVEVQAGNLLIIAIYLAAGTYHDEPAASWRAIGRMVVAGFLLGGVFCLRFQLLPALLVVAVWTCRRDIRHRWLPLALGGLLPVVVLGLTDLMAWGAPFASILRNFRVNIIEHVSEQFGVRPFYYYPAKWLLAWGAASVPIALTALLGVDRAPLLGVVALTILVAHSVIGHKEISFVYAALPPLLIIAGLGTTRLVELFARRSSLPFDTRPVLGITAGTGALWLVTSVTTGLSEGFVHQWLAHRNALLAQAALRHEPELCGLGLRWPPQIWYYSGGTVYLGRPIPIYAFASPTGVARVAPAVNFVLGDRDVANGLPGFALVRCWGSAEAELSGEPELCMARAESGKTCIPDPDFALTAVPDLGRPWTTLGADSPEGPRARK
jgi:hypothetical protein